MKKIIALALLTATLTATQVNADCYWVCSAGQWVPIKTGMVICPVKPMSFCPL